MIQEKVQEKRLIVDEKYIKEECGVFFFVYWAHPHLPCVFRPAMFDQQILAQYKCHVLAYAEMLFRWQLLNKRLELLKSAKMTTYANNREAVFGTQ